MVKSDFRSEVEICPYRSYAMKNVQYNPYLMAESPKFLQEQFGSLWIWLSCPVRAFYRIHPSRMYKLQKKITKEKQKKKKRKLKKVAFVMHCNLRAPDIALVVLGCFCNSMPHSLCKRYRLASRHVANALTASPYISDRGCQCPVAHSKYLESY